MAEQWKGHISDEEEKYLSLLLDHLDPLTKETGLERLCAWYRRGFRLKRPHGVQQKLNGLLYCSSPNVRRWTLNAIALIGTKKDNLQAVLEVVQRDRMDADVLGAGVAALVRLVAPDDLADLLKSIDVPLEGACLLAAAQQSNAFMSTLAKKRLNPENGDASELRLASVLIGLEKAPENLFSLSLPNKAVIGALNKHHDPLVAQYSVWGIHEHGQLGVGDLGLNLKDIEGCPDNVRRWLYQLLVANNADAALS